MQLRPKYVVTGCNWPGEEEKYVVTGCNCFPQNALISIF
jgi:hypothetical protein